MSKYFPVILAPLFAAAAALLCAASRLGEWMEIGGMGQDASRQQTVLLGRTASATLGSQRMLIKVEEVR